MILSPESETETALPKSWTGLTPYHAKYYAYELTKRCSSDSIEKLAEALVDAQVDLNPHQVEAALFAFRSPLSKGAVLADEVGLGKTIESRRTQEYLYRLLEETEFGVAGTFSVFAASFTKDQGLFPSVTFFTPTEPSASGND